MQNDKQNISIFDQCTAVAAEVIGAQQKPRVYSLSQRGFGVTGSQKKVLACVIETVYDSRGRYQGETIYPAIGALQAEPQVVPLLRDVEIRPSIILGGKTGIVYRKLPLPWGDPNSWVESGEKAIYASVDQWGQINSDRQMEMYRFEEMLNPPELPEEFPSIKLLFDELLADSVIDSVDHPVIQRLCGYSPAPMAPDLDEEEDDESAY
ncbi:MAG: hypothetical protein V7742_14075 [Halioglobus sp.]